MATPPDRYPLHDTNETNSATLPTIYSLNGYPNNSVADARATNALLGANGGWVQYNDFTLVRSEDIHSSATAYRISVDLSYDTIAGLGPLSPTSRPVYVFDGNVIRFRDSFLVDAGLDPITFEASKRTWIYCDANGTVRIDIVALATAATPAVGEFVVIAVDTNATDISAIVTTSSPKFELHYTGPTFVFDSDLSGGLGTFTDLVSDTAVIEKLTAGGNTTSDPSAEVIASTGAVSLVVTGNGTEAAATIDGGTGPGLVVTSAGATSPNFALTVTQTGQADAVNSTSGATSGAGFRGITGNSVDAGVEGQSANLAASVAVNGLAAHASAFGVVGRSHAAGASTASAVLGLAFADAMALRGLGVDGYGVVAESDTTNPKRSALRVVPQNNDQTTPLAGDIRNASERLNKFRGYTTQHESFHSSAKGHVVGYATNADGSSITTTGDILDITIVAEQTGVVELHVTGALAPGADATTTTVLFKDITNAVTAFTSQAYAAYDSDGGLAASRMMPFEWRKMYTLVTTTTLFRVRFNFSAVVNWYDLVFTVRGVY